MNIKKSMILAFSLFLTFALYACGDGVDYDDMPHVDYDDMPHIDDFSELSEYDETGEMYLLYFYLPQCPACQEVFDDIADHYMNHHDDVPIVLSYQTTGTPPAEVTHVPTMLLMQSGEVLEGPIVGVEPIRDLLADIQSGNYTP